MKPSKPRVDGEMKIFSNSREQELAHPKARMEQKTRASIIVLDGSG
jgi:hypothetical protein